ncbi:hypothetical protein GCM10011492_00880 [Flexivirga endophytica]|uniref:Uncharacterized protein n=1 Tax=Flexivirga endophytica TaxID=1849103 RepID=A0A916SUU5_9MICO|nr:hypothetical protein GCM10011492_00880 [Flexivirga endophytica]GHB65220.1 hypothetical protein GCM10008112_37610 [Flexivirga endophytica]
MVIPEDTTPLRGAGIDARVRVAWLLRLNRLAKAPGPAGRFVDMLRAQGCALGPSTLCRYETGVEAVPKSVVRSYEKTLELPAGQLLGVCFGIDRMFGPALAPEGARGISRTALSDALGEWEARVAMGAMTGPDWIHVADAITRPTGPVLPLSMLHGWVDQLVTETMRSVRHAYATRIHALTLLLGDRAAGRVVLDAVARMVAQPGAQSVTNVIPVLGSSPDPAVLQWLVQHFERSDGEQMWGAAYGLLNQICNGRMPADMVPRIARAALGAAGDGPSRGGPAFAVAQRLSATLTQQVVARLGYYAAPTVAGARVQSPAGLSAYRSAALQESGLDDPLLDRLLREALSPDFVERRHHSSLMLAASPYRSVVAEVATEQVADPAGPYAAHAAAHALGYLAGAEQRDRLLDLLATVPEERAAMLVALAHSGGVPAHVDLVAFAAEPELVSTVVYAAGMSNHPDLARLAAGARTAGVQAQRSAIWWQQTGAAISEVPAVLTAPECLTLAG